MLPFCYPNVSGAVYRGADRGVNLRRAEKRHERRVETRVAAAIAILDRGWGRPTQAVDANVSVFDRMTDGEQKAMLAALAALKDA